MHFKRFSGIILLIIGIVLILFSNYIADQITMGKNKISNAQEQVNQANSLFSLNPYTKEAGKIATDSGQRKINEGQKQVDKYEQISHFLLMGGIVLAVAGSVLIIINFISKKRKN